MEADNGNGAGRAAMISDRDMYSAAALLIRKHGSKAEAIAKNRAKELKAQRDEAGYAAFTRIVGAVEELLQLKPGPGQRRH